MRRCRRDNDARPAQAWTPRRCWGRRAVFGGYLCPTRRLRAHGLGGSDAVLGRTVGPARAVSPERRIGKHHHLDHWPRKTHQRAPYRRPFDLREVVAAVGFEPTTFGL